MLFFFTRTFYYGNPAFSQRVSERLHLPGDGWWRLLLSSSLTSLHVGHEDIPVCRWLFLFWMEPFPVAWRQEVPCGGQNPILEPLQPTVPGEQNWHLQSNHFFLPHVLSNKQLSDTEIKRSLWREQTQVNARMQFK